METKKRTGITELEAKARLKAAGYLPSLLDIRESSSFSATAGYLGLYPIVIEAHVNDREYAFEYSTTNELKQIARLRLVEFLESIGKGK